MGERRFHPGKKEKGTNFPQLVGKAPVRGASAHVHASQKQMAYAISGQRSGDELAAYAKGLLQDAAVPSHLQATIAAALGPAAAGAADVRPGLVEEALHEALSFARELEMAPGQAGQLLVLVEEVLAAAAAGASLESALATWAASLAAASCALDEDVHVQTVLFSVALRNRLDAWMRDIGPLLPRHWMMLETALAVTDTRGRRPVVISVLVETPLAPPALEDAVQQS